MSMLAGVGGAESGGGEACNQLDEEDSGGMLGNTSSMLRGSMKSMGIGKKDDASPLSVGRVRHSPFVTCRAWSILPAVCPMRLIVSIMDSLCIYADYQDEVLHHVGFCRWLLLHGLTHLPTNHRTS